MRSVTFGHTDELYVGYRNAPPRLVWFLRRVAAFLIAAMLGLAWSASRLQDDPGGGVWHEDITTLVGYVSSTPYPLLRVACDQPGRPVETILLVAEGKRGAGEHVAGLHGRVVRARGRILERDRWRMLELAELEALGGGDSPPAAGAPRLPPADATAPDGKRITLRGEIIDPKCYSGAMKPGEGKAHKECATLCISGGIPPMLMVDTSTGGRDYFLLTDSSGGALAGDVLREQVLPYVADAIEVTGELEIRDDQARLRIDPTSIRRP